MQSWKVRKFQASPTSEKHAKLAITYHAKWKENTAITWTDYPILLYRVSFKLIIGNENPAKISSLIYCSYFLSSMLSWLDRSNAVINLEPIK